MLNSIEVLIMKRPDFYYFFAGGLVGIGLCEAYSSVKTITPTVVLVEGALLFIVGFALVMMGRPGTPVPT